MWVGVTCNDPAGRGTGFFTFEGVQGTNGSGDDGVDNVGLISITFAHDESGYVIPTSTLEAGIWAP